MPFLADVGVSSYLVPRTVLEIQQRPGSTFQSGINSANGFCWVLSGQQLYIWKYREGRDARLRTLRLPQASGDKHYVQIISHPSSNAVSVLALSDSGCLTVWLDASYLSEPVVQQIVTGPGGTTTSVVSAFSATAAPNLTAGPAFVAALASTNGSWYLIQGSTQGIFTKQLAVSAAQQESKGVLGALGSVISYAYTEAFDPSAKYIKKSPSGRPAIAVHVTPVDATHIRVFLLNDQSLDCWMVRGMVTCMSRACRMHMYPCWRAHADRLCADHIHACLDPMCQW